MKFVTVDETNIKMLYEMNRQLAIDEGQEKLFTAGYVEYKEQFVGNSPIAFGLLIYLDEKPVGFVIYFYKLATYLGSKVIYIEDIYLNRNHCTEENISEIFTEMKALAVAKKACRVEVRVLKNYSFDQKSISGAGYEKVEKWDVYRLEI